MTDTTWPTGVLLLDPRSVLKHEDALRVARSIADARPQAALYTDPWIVSPAPNPRHLLLYRVSWRRGWVGTPAALVRRVRQYYTSKETPKF